MQKNSKSVASVVAISRRAKVEVPEVLNMDVMATMLDEDLVKRLCSLEDDRMKVLGSCDDSQSWEVELAYVRRELQIRRERRAAHERYVRLIEREHSESEANLPVADLDNSYFLRLMGELN
jgi:hypothetical protein